MSDGSESRVLVFKKRMITLQIIHLALLLGVAVFGVVVLVLPASDRAPGNLMFSYVAVASAAGSLVMSGVVSAMMARGLVQQKLSATPVGKKRRLGEFLVPLCEVYTTRNIVRMAILEGAAFFCLVAYQIEHQWWTVAVAAVLWLWMLVSFPTLGRVEQWCREQFENWTLVQK